MTGKLTRGPWEASTFHIRIHLEKELFAELAELIKSNSLGSLKFRVEISRMKGLFQGGYMGKELKLLEDQDVEGLESGTEIDYGLRARLGSSRRTQVQWTYKNNFVNETENKAEQEMERLRREFEEREKRIKDELEKKHSAHQEEMNLFKFIKAIVWFLALILLAILFI